MNQQFAYTEEQLAEIAQGLIAKALQLGASDAKVSISEMSGLSVEVLDGRVTTRTAHTQSGISLTVFRGQRQGFTHSTDFSPANVQRMVSAALDIARYASEDPDACLVDSAQLSTVEMDLQMDNPWSLDIEQALRYVRQVEDGIHRLGAEVRSDGASLETARSQMLLATSQGFCRSASRTDHSVTANVIASRDEQRKTDSWTDYSTSSRLLMAPERVGEIAARSAIESLGGRSLTSRSCPVLLAPRAAHSLIQHFSQAVSGGELSRDASFLRESLGRSIFAEHLDVFENPFQLHGTASGCFDADGVAGQQRAVVDQGVVRGYFLSGYTARRLGMVSTGNAQGAYNLSLKSRLTKPGDDLTTMLGKLNNGLFITHLIGDGVRLATGDYSRAAQGFWVENGEIQFPVDQVTVAGNLCDIYAGILAVGSDSITLGNISGGSILINDLRIGGQ
ncbi:TldD/PmbA family protein [Pseudomonas sp. ICMP 460]|uniref:TldD/PmbA family protein n=1 Tax=Pseudomonas sp. ICMP 460 TaxID=1718917 RepID=UPI000C07AE6C|nr:metallopeptidase TldD-related protein [Pseudomonas sp. ICMP 460]PHN24796.1 hypothetical protein AO240_14550 [Pseudomonas sp. ICMP 460]